MEPLQNIANYPEFGVPVGNPYVPKWQQTAAKVALVAVAVLIGASLGGLVGAGIAFSACVILKIAYDIYRHVNQHRYKLEYLPIEERRDTPKLGEYIKTDLRVSNHATESLEWKKELILSAQKSIELSANFAGGEPFREVLSLIEQRMKLFPELTVHLILSRDLLEEEDIRRLEEINKKFPATFHYLITDRIYTTVPQPMSEENHVKLLVVDEKYFVMGGTGIATKMGREIALVEENAEQENLGSSMIDKTFRDSDLIGCGFIAKTMRRQFFNLHKIWEYRMTGQEENRFFDVPENEKGTCELFHQEEGLIKEAPMKFIVGGPEHRQKNPITEEVTSLLKGAVSEVRIANLLFNPDEEVKAALKEVRERDVPITGYLNGTGEDSAVSHYIYALPNRYNYNALTTVHENQQKDQLYHKKLMTIDSQYTMIGSFNFGMKSAKCDYECVSIIDDTRVAALMNAALNEDEVNSITLKGEELKSRWKWNRLGGALAIQTLGPFFG